MAAKKKPFVIDMRHNQTADSSYGVASTWKGALTIAGKFWEKYDGTFDPKTEKFGLNEEDFDPDCLEVDSVKGVEFRLVHSGGEGPCIFIKRAGVE